jgi:hypothetical protein
MCPRTFRAFNQDQHLSLFLHLVSKFSYYLLEMAKQLTALESATVLLDSWLQEIKRFAISIAPHFLTKRVTLGTVMGLLKARYIMVEDENVMLEYWQILIWCLAPTILWLPKHLKEAVHFIKSPGSELSLTKVNPSMILVPQCASLQCANEFFIQRTLSVECRPRSVELCQRSRQIFVGV